VRVVPRLDPAPPYVLLGADGDPVSNAALWGRPYVLAFRGPGDEALAGAMRDVARELDSPLVAVAGGEVADVPGWRLLTGSGDDVRTLASGVGVWVRLGEDGSVAGVEPRMALVDGHGVLRGLHPPSPDAAERLAADVRLVRDEEESTGARRVLYEAAHLLACYR
jgi:hypothetical protein